MASTLLLQVRTPFVLLEIYGPTQSHWGATSVTNESLARLIVESSMEPTTVVFTDIKGHEHILPSEQIGPFFFEDTQYRLRVRSLIPECNPTLVHRDPHFLQEIDSYTDTQMSAGPINFRRQVGLSTLEVRVEHETLRVTIEVFPTKLDYQQDYKTLLSDVASAARGLALEYLRATYRSGSGANDDHITDLEWLTLLRNEIGILEKSVRYINAHPHRSLSRELKETPLEKIKQVDSFVRRSVLRGQGQGPWAAVPNIGRVHTIISAAQNYESLDTPEHCWLQVNLALVKDRLTGLHSSIAREIGGYEKSRRAIAKRLLAEERELAEFIGIIERLLSLPIFTTLRKELPFGFTSLTLLSGAGYSDAYRAIMILRLGLNINGDPFDLSVMDVHELYETWCFISILRQMALLTGGRRDVNTLLQVEESGIRVRLLRGEQSAITHINYETNQKIIVSYNPQFAGLTGDQRPDIVLRFQHDGWPDLIVVFDAKYRLDASDEYQKRFGTAGPPQDAINALHRYRDAIVLGSAKHNSLHRPVVKGVALFPLTAEASRDFTASRLFNALETLGIGALPFLPSNTDLVEMWLKYLLALKPEDLAEAGPPFAGIIEKSRRASLITS